MFHQDLPSLFEVGTDCKERPQSVVCYRAEDEPGGFEGEAEEWKCETCLFS